MPTFLVTQKMNPALAARVEKAVSGGRATSPRVMRLGMAGARVVFVLAIVLGIRAILLSRQHDAAEVERLRGDLSSRVGARIGTVSPEDLGAVSRASSWIERIASTPAGDFSETVAPEVADPDALGARLAAPLVWVRGPVAGFATPTLLADTARVSGKDALLYCLLDPPAARTEKAVLEKVRIVQSAGPAFDERTASVRRLDEAVIGLPFLSSQWAERVRTQTDRNALVLLGREWERAPIDRAIAAAQARLFLFALDEPGDQPGPTELDGERSHVVRVALVDLSKSAVLLATRRRVDPSWISEARRPTQASALDSCALAFDIRGGLRKK